MCSSGVEDKTIYHKNLKRVTYVIGDVAGKEESPVYAILAHEGRHCRAEAPGGLRAQAVLFRPALARGPLRHEVGRRVAHHL